MKKITIIGAGSLVFSSRLTADILTYKNLEDAHFALVDVDKERLDYAGKIIKRIFKEGNYKNATYSVTTNHRKALENADYVITSILVGGYDAIKKEIDIPMKYGVDQCIGDTLTPGGIMRCLRTLPPLVEIAKAIVEICPKAYLLNYTNPMSMLSWGIYKAVPEIKYVGLCHSVQGTSNEWASRLGVKIEDVNFECAGINHQAWFTKFEKNGVDLLPKIRKLALKKEIYNNDTSRMEMVKYFGFPVTESSGHNTEYHPWFRKSKKHVKKFCKGGSWNGGHGFIKELYCRKDWKKTMKKMADWDTPVDLNRSLEFGSKILNALAGGEPAIIHGNVRNDSLIDNLPQGCCVEVPCYVDKNGIQPIKIGNLPTHLAAINARQVTVQQLAVEAALETDPEKVFQAMAMDPLTSMKCTLDEIREMTIELMQAHKKYIPLFKNKKLSKKPVI